MIPKPILIIATIVGLLACVSATTPMRFDVSPTNCTESLDKVVIITCEVDAQPTADVVIQISRQNKPLALIKSENIITYGDGEAQRIQAERQIIGSRTSRLKVTILYPQQEDTGIYTCSVVYTDNSGILKMTTSQSFLNVYKLDISEQAIKIKELETNMKVLMEKMTGALSTKEAPLSAFSATITREKYYIENGQTIVFNNIITNNGMDFNPSTGIYTAPVSGLYALFLNLEMEDKGTGAGFSLRAGSRELGRLYVENKDHGDQSAISSVVNLSRGTKVKVVVSYKEKPKAYLYHNHYCAFSGYLIARS